MAEQTDETIEEQKETTETPAVEVDSASNIKDTEESDSESQELDDEPVEMLSREDTARAIYAMLFTSDKPLNISSIADALGDVEKDIVEILIEELTEDIAKQDVPFQFFHNGLASLHLFCQCFCSRTSCRQHLQCSNSFLTCRLYSCNFDSSLAFFFLDNDHA